MPVELSENSLQNLLYSSFWDVVERMWHCNSPTDFSCYCSCHGVSDILRAAASVTLLASSRYLAIVRISRRGRGKKGSLGADAFSEQLVALLALRVTAIGAPVIHVSRGSLESKREATWEAGICTNYAKVFTLLGPS